MGWSKLTLLMKLALDGDSKLSFDCVGVRVPFSLFLARGPGEVNPGLVLVLEILAGVADAIAVDVAAVA